MATTPTGTPPAVDAAVTAAEAPPAPRPRVRAPRLLVLAQALVPGLGAVLAGRVATGLVTFFLWPVTIITTHLRLLGDAGEVFDGNLGVVLLKALIWPLTLVTVHRPATSGVSHPGTGMAVWLGLLALVWLNLVYRGYVQARAATLDGAGIQRPIGQRIGLGAWLASRNWLVVVGAVFLIDRMALDAEVDFREFFKAANIQALKRISSGLVHPDFSIVRMVIEKYAWVTLEMAVMGTIIGAAFSAPISFLGARNLLGRNPGTAPVYYVTRFLLSVIRSIPTLIWGLMAISFGLGHFPGVIALSIFSFGLTAKLFSEAIEGIDWGPVEAVTAAGANPLHTLVFGVVPQVLPYFVSHLLYCLEVNVHSSVVLGLIGAGGLGLIVNEYIATFHWEQASTVLIITIVMTLSIDYGSAYIRSRIV